MAILNQGGMGFPAMAGAPQALQMAYMRDPRLRLAQQLQAGGADTSPVGHWTQGAARLAQALAGMRMEDRADKEYQGQAKQYQDDMRALYAPVSEMAPGQSGAGPRPDAQMTTRAPTLQEILSRGQSLQSPYAQEAMRGFQQMAIQQGAQEATDARRAKATRDLEEWKVKNDPKRNLITVGNTVIDAATRKPVFTGQQQNEYAFENVNGQIVAISKSDPTKRQVIGQAGGGAFAGNGMEAQAWNMLIDPKADPSSPAYAAAYQHLTQPKLQMVPGADGQPVMSQVTPQLPPNIRPPVFAQQPPQAMPQPAAPAQGQPAPQPQAGSLPPAVNTGGLSVQPIAQPKPPQFTEGQANAGLYADRISNALPIIERYGNEATSFRNKIGGAVPGVGNFVVTPEYQQLQQAQRDFINAVLRRESGAVIADSEFANASQQYFPQPGDTPEVIAQKKANRETALEGIARAAGPAYKRPATPQQGNGADLRAKYGLE